MLKSVLALSFVTFLGATSLSSAYVFDDTLSPDTVPSISVTITDETEGGCWTNISDVKSYAEEKLKLLGYNVILKPRIHRLAVRVVSLRTPEELCVGVVTLNIGAVGKLEGLYGVHIIANSTNIFANSKNANIAIFDFISSFMKELE
jgi:hypothetical protein